MAKLPKAKGLGDAVAVSVVALPVPVRLTVAEPPLVVAMDKVVLTRPTDVPGTKSPISVHGAPAANVKFVAGLAQVPPVRGECSALGLETVIPVRVAFPVFRTVKVEVALVEPSATFPKAMEVGDTFSIGAVATPVPLMFTVAEPALVVEMFNVAATRPSVVPGTKSPLSTQEAPGLNVVRRYSMSRGIELGWNLRWIFP